MTRTAPLPREGPSARLLSVASPIGGSSGTGLPSGPGAETHERRGVSRVNSKRLMCNLGHGRGAARLFYWMLPDGNIEFEAVRNHDAIARS